MKLRILGLAALAASALTANVAFADNETNPETDRKDLDQIPGTIPQIEPSAIFNVIAKLPDVPTTVPVFQVLPHDPSEPSDLQLALQDRLQFKGIKADFDKDDQGVAAVMQTDEAGRTVEAFRSGALFYMEEELFKEQAPDMLNKLDLTKGEAVDFFASEGQAFLDSIGMKRGEMSLKDVSYMQVKSVQDRQNEETTKIVGAAAHFRYELGGIPAWGPGAKTTVYFGEQGPTGFYDAMRALEPVAEAKLFDPALAVETYIRGDETPRSMLRLHTGVVDQAVIEEVKLVYYMAPGNEDQSQVEPHYLIQGTMYGWNPGPDPENPRKGATDEAPAPFVWLARASEPVPEPGLAAGLAFGLMGLVGFSRRRR